MAGKRCPIRAGRERHDRRGERAAKQSPGMTRRDGPEHAKHCGRLGTHNVRISTGRSCIDTSNQLSRRHRNSTVGCGTYQQPLITANAVRPARPSGGKPVPRAPASLNRARAATRRVPRSRARTESTPDETAATCAAPSRDAPRSGSRASRSRNRNRRPIHRRRARASRA